MMNTESIDLTTAKYPSFVTESFLWHVFRTLRKYPSEWCDLGDCYYCKFNLVSLCLHQLKEYRSCSLLFYTLKNDDKCLNSWIKNQQPTEIIKILKNTKKKMRRKPQSNIIFKKFWINQLTKKGNSKEYIWKIIKLLRRSSSVC